MSCERADAGGQAQDPQDPVVHRGLGISPVFTALTGASSQGLSERDIELARQISAAARELEMPADPAAIQDIDLTIDALVGSDVIPFWRVVLGCEQVGDEDLLDPRRCGPLRPQRNRVHVDVWVPHDRAEDRVAAAIAAGGHLIQRRARTRIVDPGRRRGQRGRRGPHGWAETEHSSHASRCGAIRNRASHLARD